MPAFSELSKAQLKSCHQDLQTLFIEVIKTFDCKILEGYRDQADQDLAFETGHSKEKFPNGKHNQYPSHAADAAPVPIDWTNTKRFYWFAGYVLGIADMLFKSGAMTHKIRWGGDWSGDLNDLNEKGLNDLVHFEIVDPK